MALMDHRETAKCKWVLGEALQWGEHSDACEGGWTWASEHPIADGDFYECACWVRQAKALLDTIDLKDKP